MASVKFFASILLVLHACMAKASDLDTMLAEYPRAAQAALNTEGFWQQTFADHSMPFPPRQLFFRVYKAEQELEIWAAMDGDFTLVKTFEVCMVPGKPGPKLRQGDKQVPEGVYYIDTLNPNSDFHLSMRVNYPNAADLIRSAAEKDPGGDIYIHGDCYSVGCLPMQDEPVEEIFWLAAQHQHHYPENQIAVYIFPARFNGTKWSQLQSDFPQWSEFWQSLEAIDKYFTQNLRLPKVSISPEGVYHCSN